MGRSCAVCLEHTVSLFAAIVSSVVTGVVLVIVQIARDKKISPFTAYIAASVAVFGVLDMKYQTGFGRPIIAELAQKQRAEPFKPSAITYLRGLTIAWGFFLDGVPAHDRSNKHPVKGSAT